MNLSIFRVLCFVEIYLNIVGIKCIKKINKKKIVACLVNTNM